MQSNHKDDIKLKIFSTVPGLYVDCIHGALENTIFMFYNYYFHMRGMLEDKTNYLSKIIRI